MCHSPMKPTQFGIRSCLPKTIVREPYEKEQLSIFLHLRQRFELRISLSFRKAGLIVN